jgi:hypothetical protein
MWSFLTRPKADPGAGPAHPAQELLTEFDLLDSRSQDDAARQVALLWSYFVDEFGGPRPFLDAPPTQQQAYLDGLVRLVERSNRPEGTERSRYFYSITMLRYFLEALRTGDNCSTAIALSKRLTWLTERGRVLQPDVKAA